jgi:hypothetical protein
MKLPQATQRTHFNPCVPLPPPPLPQPASSSSLLLFAALAALMLLMNPHHRCLKLQLIAFLHRYLTAGRCCFSIRTNPFAP